MEFRGKCIQLIIPEHEELILNFNPEENYLILKIGSECLIESRKYISKLSQIEIYDKIQTQTNKQIQMLELKIATERSFIEHYKTQEDIRIEHAIQKSLKSNGETLDFIKKNYENEIKSLKELLIMGEKETIKLQHILTNYENDKKTIIQYEVGEIVKLHNDKYDLLLNEKDKQYQLTRETFDKAILTLESTTSKKSLVGLGKIGETAFQDLAETFKDFDGFELIDVHSSKYQGDFHLKFRDFDILVDAKNYSNNVPSSQREKIKHDLRKSELHFAWLISLNTTIDKFDRAPFMFEWIENDKCICYVNAILKSESPQDILRSLWFTCKELNKIVIKDDLGENELSSMKENQLKMKDKVKNMRKNIKEMNGSIHSLKKMCDNMDENLKDLLNEETIIDTHYGMLSNWWHLNIGNGDANISSTDLWFKFKRDHKNMLHEIDANKFKDILCAFVTEDCLLRPKTKNGAIEIKNICWKN